MAESSPSPVSSHGRDNSIGSPPHFPSSTPVSEERFLCSVCKNLLTDPVSTPCGHNFCKTCLTQFWDQNDCCRCPMCGKTFERRLDLTVNDLMSSMIAELRNVGKAKIPAKPGEAQCDMCLDVKQKAVKSCLECYSRLCELHIQYHSGLPQYRPHKLIDVVDNIDIYICQRHKKPLDLFCRDDHICVCQFCTEGEHKTHTIVPIEEESTERKNYMRVVQAEIQQSIEDRKNKIQEVKNSAEFSKKSTEKVFSDTVKIFSALINFIERSHSELLKSMEEKRKAAERQAEELIKGLEKEITELKRRDTELEQLSHTEDHLHLLQVYPSLCRPQYTTNWTDISTEPYLSVETVRKALSQLQKSLNDQLYENELKKIKEYKVDVTLDPETAHASLILSQDGKQVRKGIRRVALFRGHAVFYPYTNVLGKEGFSSGKFYYEVQVKGKTSWVIGVAKESITSNTEFTLCPTAGFWTLTQRGNGCKVCKACHNPPVLLSLRKKPLKVGVFVDYDEGLVSFYDVEARSHIYSFTGQSFTGVLYPYFNPGPNEGGKNSVPLTITPISKMSLRY